LPLDDTEGRKKEATMRGRKPKSAECPACGAPCYSRTAARNHCPRRPYPEGRIKGPLTEEQKLQRATDARRARRERLEFRGLWPIYRPLFRLAMEYAPEDFSTLVCACLLATHFDSVRQRKRDYYAEHSESGKSSTRKWRTANRSKANQYDQVRRPERRAKKHGITESGKHTAQEIAALFERQSSHCAICSQPIRIGFRQLDHIIPLKLWDVFKASVPYLWNELPNLQWLCPPCNQLKGSKPPALSNATGS